MKQKVTVTLDKEVLAGIDTLARHGWNRSAWINYVLNLHIRALIEHAVKGASEVVVNDIMPDKMKGVI